MIEFLVSTLWLFDARIWIAAWRFFAQTESLSECRSHDACSHRDDILPGAKGKGLKPKLRP